jgi:Ni/Co efflux regulator RcnB
MKTLSEIRKLAIVIAASFAAVAPAVHATAQTEGGGGSVRVGQQDYNQNSEMRAPDNQGMTGVRYASSESNAAYSADASGSTQSSEGREMTVSTYSPPIVIIRR